MPSPWLNSTSVKTRRFQPGWTGLESGENSVKTARLMLTAPSSSPHSWILCEDDESLVGVLTFVEVSSRHARSDLGPANDMGYETRFASRQPMGTHRWHVARQAHRPGRTAADDRTF